MEKKTKLGSSIYIGEKITSDILQDIFKGYEKKSVFFITDKNLYNYYEKWLLQIIPKSQILCLPAGETTKNFLYLQQIYDFLLQKNAHRDSLIIAFGGGVIGDIAGFAAASFLRGVDFIQVPTSLIAQVDSSIGGKTGINHPLAKNTIGAFYQPLCSIIDINFLKTLPEREFTSGYAEIIKHSFIQDKKFFLKLKEISSISDADLIPIISHSCKIKLKVVEKDEKESNLRAILNFGHTIGHWIEAHTQYCKYLHGEAIFGGMDFALWWSQKHLGFSKTEYAEAYRHYKKFAPKISLKNVNEKNFSNIISKDKKSYNQTIKFIGIEKIGKAVIIPKVEISSLWQNFLEYLQNDKALISI